MNIGIAKQEAVRTLHGKARWCYLSAPDTGFNKEEYKVDLEVPKVEAQEHMKAIKKIIDNTASGVKLDKIREENRNLQNEIVSLTYKNKELHKEIQKLKLKQKE